MRKILFVLFAGITAITITTPSLAEKLDLYDCYTKLFGAAIKQDIRYYETDRIATFCNNLKTQNSWTANQLQVCKDGLQLFVDEAWVIMDNNEGDWEEAMQYFDNITELCEICPQGFYSPDIGATDCEICPSGYTTPDGEHIYYSESDCEVCYYGTYWYYDGVSATCEQCEAGLYSDTLGAEYCEHCPDGTYNEGWGNSSCEPCPMLDGIQLTSDCGWDEVDEERGSKCGGIRSCYIPQGTQIQDEKGILRYTDNCYYGQ